VREERKDVDFIRLLGRWGGVHCTLRVTFEPATAFLK
jgi:hypothetical protein